MKKLLIFLFLTINYLFASSIIDINDIKLGSDISLLENKVLLGKAEKYNKKVSFYIRNNEFFNVEGVEFKKIIYIFENNKLTMIQYHLMENSSEIPFKEMIEKKLNKEFEKHVVTEDLMLQETVEGELLYQISVEKKENFKVFLFSHVPLIMKEYTKNEK